MSELIVYRIRDLQTGLYSKGGTQPIGFNKVGKIWKTRGHLVNHLRQFAKMPAAYKNAVVVASKVTEIEIEQADVTEWFNS